MSLSPNQWLRVQSAILTAMQNTRQLGTEDTEWPTLETCYHAAVDHHVAAIENPVRWTPTHILAGNADTGYYNNQPITQTAIYPPGAHPPKCFLTADCWAVEMRTPRGSRWYGFPEARIDSYLRVRVTIRLGDEVLRNNWEIADPE